MVYTGDEKRRAARIRFRLTDNLKVAYKFLSRLENYQCDKVFEGFVLNLSKGGCLFVGSIPGTDWLPQLGQGLVLIGMNIMVPDARPVKVLSSLRWTRSALESEGFNRWHYELGVRFEQIEAPHKANLEKFLIGYQLRTRRFTLRDELEGGWG